MGMSITASHRRSVAAEDRAFAVRLPRYCARNPVALSRLAYQSNDATVTYHSDKPTGPTAGSETPDVLEFLGRAADRCAPSPAAGFLPPGPSRFAVRRLHGGHDSGRPR